MELDLLRSFREELNPVRRFSEELDPLRSFKEELDPFRSLREELDPLRSFTLKTVGGHPPLTEAPAPDLLTPGLTVCFRVFPS